MSTLEEVKAATLKLVDEGKLADAFEYFQDALYDLDMECSLLVVGLQAAIESNNKAAFRATIESYTG